MEEMEANEVDAVPPHNVRCRNVYFEETPARLITGGIITEHGALACGAAQHAWRASDHFIQPQTGIEPAAELAARLAPAVRGVFADAFLDD